MKKFIGLYLALIFSFFAVTEAQSSFFTAGSFSGSSFIKLPGVTLPPAPSSDWFFNEPSGTTFADNKGVANFTGNGTIDEQTGQYIAQDNNAANVWAHSSAVYGTSNDFSVGMWVRLKGTVTVSKDLLAMGANASSSASTSHAWNIIVGNPTGFTLGLHSGASATTFNAAGAIDNATDYCIIFTYDRVGAGTSLANIYWKEYGGTTWKTAGTSTGSLINQNAAWYISTKFNESQTGLGHNARRYRITFWDNRVLSTDERDAYFNWGPEGGSF